MSNEAHSRIDQVHQSDEALRDLSDQEKYQAAAMFEGLVEAVLERGRQTGQTVVDKERRGSVDGRSELSSLQHCIFEQTLSDGTKLLIRIDAADGDYRDSSDYSRQMQIQALDEAGYSRQVSLYDITDDYSAQGKVVRRYQVDDAYALALEDPVRVEGIDIFPSDRIDEILALAQEMDSAENEESEVEEDDSSEDDVYGYEEIRFKSLIEFYGEIVGVDEIQKLAKLIDDLSADR